MTRPGPLTSLRVPLLAGTAIGLSFFAGLGGWAATAPLAGAAIAPAVVAPDGSRKTIQHLEGGIVRRILIQDGSVVAAGQELIELDDRRPRPPFCWAPCRLPGRPHRAVQPHPG